MRHVAYFNWWITNEVTGRRVQTRFAMPVEVAMAQWPGAEPVEGSLEVREIPETDAEFAAASTRAWQRRGLQMGRRAADR
jgi:hypothetical protein